MAKAKLAFALLVAQPGTPFVYYGEELGMVGAASRDEDKRTPMRWTPTAPQYGFTTGATNWYGTDAPRPRAPTCRAQQADPDSLWSFYRRLIAMRHGSAALSTGDSVRPDVTGAGDAVFAMLRTAPSGERAILVINLSAQPVGAFTVAVSGNPTVLEAEGLASPPTSQNGALVVHRARRAVLLFPPPRLTRRLESLLMKRLIASLAIAPLLGCATAKSTEGAPPAPATSAVTQAPGATTAALDGDVDLTDPAGDDFGPGTYVYPTDAVYKPGSFDITRVQVMPQGDDVEFRITVKSRIEDPWDSKAWGGNGFSVQMGFVFIDQDHKPGSGVTKGLPGLNVRFAPENAWEKVVILSPQGQTRLNSEIDIKAPDLKSNIIVPKITRASGRTLIAIVGKDQLGALPQAGWGYQVAMQSNEGFPDKTDLLTRKVNEFEGQHRFGGGSDYDNDPHVIDILTGQAKGAADEVELQKQILGAYKKDVHDADRGGPRRAPDDLPGSVSARPMRPPSTTTRAALALLAVRPPRRARARTTSSSTGRSTRSTCSRTTPPPAASRSRTRSGRTTSAGHNGACTEFELNIKGRVSDRVSAGRQHPEPLGRALAGLVGERRHPLGLPDEHPLHREHLGREPGHEPRAVHQAARGVDAHRPADPDACAGSTSARPTSACSTSGRSASRATSTGTTATACSSRARRGRSPTTPARWRCPKLYIGPRWNTGLKHSDPLAGLLGRRLGLRGEARLHPGRGPLAHR